jgi:hypothetical protein
VLGLGFGAAAKIDTPVIKICPRCRRTFSGGTTCLRCSPEVALLDVAEPSVRRAFLKSDGELRTTIRTYYGARSAMLMLFVGILFGLTTGLALLRAASSLSGWQRWSLGAGAGVAAAAIPVAAAFIGAAVVHRFSKSCRKKPIRAEEIRIVRRARPGAR